ncbi:CFI-box-CTERM domain-containing protein, partial [Candidatus Skiveiella danica]|uniref:CFI-box-CTERM domain-containing protein n=1 Tax=Candidatus Skiveiella danica TaxID=3386177 RepID=UPI0039B8E908
MASVVRPGSSEPGARGLVEHEHFYREGLAATAQVARKGRCFIATCVFGEAWQTEVLRRFRDEALRPSAWGRRVIRLYYRGAPSICVILRRWPWCGSYAHGLGGD